MIVNPKCLIIGSTGRNTGKTEFACRIIENTAPGKEITGIKVIPVDKDEEKCHRGTDGCGLCNSLAGDYQIIEELKTDLSKDTSRMLKAGARKVYLLIVDRNCLECGIDAVLRIIPENNLTIIESNSVRKVLEPGLFIVIRKTEEKSIKESCAEVIGLADRIVEFAGNNWDLQPVNIVIQNERWMLT